MTADVATERRRFTRAEYYRMAEVGILGRNERVELIRGEIVTMAPQGRRHRAFVDNLTQLLAARLSGRVIVSVQMPLVLSEDTEPEPDIQLLRRREVPYKEREAHADDAVLVIEVADSGPGVAPEDAPRIFEAFYQGRRPQGGPVGGTGIGLSVVHECVQAHGGTVALAPPSARRAADAPRGAHFVVRLPLRRADDRPKLVVANG